MSSASNPVCGASRGPSGASGGPSGSAPNFNSNSASTPADSTFIAQTLPLGYASITEPPQTAKSFQDRPEPDDTFKWSLTSVFFTRRALP
ncbi:hypothetical protein MVEN_01338200 [Mycena venus]|uniref:Uncharacterized protein n=1 Tax=Mycena venus TaxID=2733690 RepID=A0A8H7CW88_9AGAR|nr:hypothetical protein MVEN_01338200 [Mycena venus]